jgi:hypothetical protein
MVSKLIRPDGTELHSVGPYYLMHLAEAQTQLSFEIGELIAAEGLDEKESDSDIVILLQDSTLDAEREKDILMRVSASSTGLQVRAGVLSELKRRGARKKLQRLCYLGKDLKDDDVVGAVQKNAPSPWGYAHTVVCMCLAKDTGDKAAAAQADAMVGGSRLDLLIETFNALRAAQDAIRAEWEEKEKLRPLSQERTIQSVAAAEGDAVGG